MSAGPREPLGHLARLGFALRSAPDVDQVARHLLDDLVELPDVARVGVALTEGGGRRLRFVANERVGTEGLEWCHIDAYDDVPLTTVVRTGEPVLGNLDELEAEYADLVAHQREQAVAAMAAWPLPGVGSPIGGIILFYDRPQTFRAAHRRLLEATARRASEAIHRVRVAVGRGPGDPSTPDDPDLVGEGVRASVLLDATTRAPSVARSFLREQLAAWQIDDEAAETAQLCLSELVTNVVMHAHTASKLVVHLEDRVLTVVVRDLGAGRSGEPARTAEPLDDDDPLRVSGRGLVLVDALADRWGSEADASGTTAWFALELVVDTAESRTG